MFLENLKDVTVGNRKNSERFDDILRNFYRKRRENVVNVFRKFPRYANVKNRKNSERFDEILKNFCKKRIENLQNVFGKLQRYVTGK